MWSALFAGLQWLFMRLFSAPATPVAQQLGQAQSQVAQEGAANEQIQAAATARADADAQRVRDDPAGGHVTTDPAAPINVNPDNRFRD